MTKTKVLLIACQLSVWCQQHPWEYDGFFLEDDYEGGIDTSCDALELYRLELKRLWNVGKRNGPMGSQVQIPRGL